MRLAGFGASPDQQPWSGEDLHRSSSSRLFGGPDTLAVLPPKTRGLTPKKLGGACLRGARALCNKLPHLETPKKRSMRKMQEEFVRECQAILEENDEVGALLFSPNEIMRPAGGGMHGTAASLRHDESIDSPMSSDFTCSPVGSRAGRSRRSSGTDTCSSDSSFCDTPTRAHRSGDSGASRRAALNIPAVAVRDMFVAVYDDDMARLEPLLARHPDAILGSWSGMSVLRYALMVHTRLENTQCLMLLLNRFTLLSQRHGTLDDLKSIFADAIMVLAQRAEHGGVDGKIESILAMCFENYVMAHGAPWVDALAERLGRHEQPVKIALGAMEVLAREALGMHASLPAVQAVCEVWAADLALMAAAHQLQLRGIDGSLCGRGHQVSRAFLGALADHPKPGLPLHATMHNRAAVLVGKDVDARLAELEMLLDEQDSAFK